MKNKNIVMFDEDTDIATTERVTDRMREVCKRFGVKHTEYFILTSEVEDTAKRIDIATAILDAGGTYGIHVVKPNYTSIGGPPLTCEGKIDFLIDSGVGAGRVVALLDIDGAVMCKSTLSNAKRAVENLVNASRTTEKECSFNREGNIVFWDSIPLYMFRECKRRGIATVHRVAYTSSADERAVIDLINSMEKRSRVVVELDVNNYNLYGDLVQPSAFVEQLLELGVDEGRSVVIYNNGSPILTTELGLAMIIVDSLQEGGGHG